MSEKEWLELLLPLLKESGTTVIHAILAFQFMAVLKASLGWIFGLWMVKIVTSTISSLIKWSIERDVDSISQKIN